MTEQVERKGISFLHMAVVVALLIVSWGMSRWGALSALELWYPASSGYELWWMWWLALYVTGQWVGRRRPVLRRICWWLWWPTLLVALAGCWQVIGYVLAKFTVGDLHYNHFLGAQRAYQGIRIYDQVGLQQSVNASPFVIALLRPFGSLTTRQFLPYWLAGNVICLLVYWLYAWRWVQQIWRSRAMPGLPEFGLLVCTTVYFNSFQRSVRLGQLDLFVMALVASGSYYVMRAFWTKDVPERAQEAVRAAFIGGVLVALAVGVKLVPVLLLGPLGLWFCLQLWRQRGRDASKDPDGSEQRADDAGVASSDVSWGTLRRRAVWMMGGLVLGGLIVFNLSMAWVGPTGVKRFLGNIPKMSKGSTAGVNFAVVARLAKYHDTRLRLKNVPLSSKYTRWVWPLRLGVLVLWLLLAWRMSAPMVPLFSLFGLACLPLSSPMCWDIYFLWCANFHWWLLLAFVVARWPVLETPTNEWTKAQKAAHQTAVLKMVLQGCLLIGSFYLLGLAGNSVMRDLHTLKLIDLELPMWFDEARIAGLFLLLCMIGWLLRPSRFVFTSSHSMDA
jgi:hypothetical protein